ncbi:hypothetical protein CYMTET_23629, partial [Cymbomonas tetramitiformis]
RLEAQGWLTSTSCSEARGSGVAEMETVLLLLQLGAATEVQDRAGHSPLHCASSAGHHQVLKVLTAGGAKVDAPCGRAALTGLHLTAQLGQAKAARVLCKAGADLEARSKEGLTPLHVAAQHGETKVVRVLVEMGASVDAVNLAGSTAAQIAQECSHAKTARALKQIQTERSHTAMPAKAEIGTSKGHGPAIAQVSPKRMIYNRRKFVDMNDDEDAPARDWLSEISEMFLNGGYFRARIPSLSPFDKIIGGLAWSIRSSNVGVDFDLFFDDDVNMGQKIKLSESIEFALKRMNCPHPLQAHQIQGQDYPTIFPVVRWLIKQVIATRQEFGDRTRRFSQWSYGVGYDYKLLDQVGKEDIKPIPGVAKVEAKYRTQRRLRRAKGVAPPPQRVNRARSVLLEYGHTFQNIKHSSTTPAKPGAKPSDGVEALAADSPGMPTASIQEGDVASQAVAAATLLRERSAGKAAAPGSPAVPESPGAEAKRDAMTIAADAAIAKAEAETASTMSEVATSLAEVFGEDDSISGSKAAKIIGLRSGEIREADTKYNVNIEEEIGGVAARMAATAKQKEALEKQFKAEEARLVKATAKADKVKAAAEEIVSERNQKLAHNERCVRELGKLEEKLKTEANIARAEQLLLMINEIAALKDEEGKFRVECKAKMIEMQKGLEETPEAGISEEEKARIEQRPALTRCRGGLGGDSWPALTRCRGVEVGLWHGPALTRCRGGKPKGTAGLRWTRCVEVGLGGDSWPALTRRDTSKWEAMRQSLAKRSRAVALLSRKLDELPARPELMQYEKRFVELYEQITAKLEETRRYYDGYNTLMDTKKFLTKEISLLNSIRSQFEAAVQTPEGREAMIQQLEGINKGLEQNFTKANDKLVTEQTTLKVQQEKHQQMIMQQRQYFTLVKEFQELCSQSEKMRSYMQKS